MTPRGRPQRWVVIPRWDEFQHYRDRNPVWIKVYTELLHDPEFLALSGHARGVLLSLWMEYASSRRQIPDDTATITRRIGLRVSRVTLDSLNDAGFIEFSASKPLAPRYRREDKEKEERSPNPAERGTRDLERNPRALGTNPRAVAEQTRPERNARRWIANGLAREVPRDHLGTVIAEEFGIRDPELLSDLVAAASATQNGTADAQAQAFFGDDLLREVPE